MCAYSRFISVVVESSDEFANMLKYHYRAFLLSFCGILLLCLSSTDSKTLNNRRIVRGVDKRSPNSYNYDVFYSNKETVYRAPPEHIIRSNPSTKKTVEEGGPEKELFAQRASVDNEEELMVRSKNGFIKGRSFDTSHIIPKYHRNNQTAPPKKLNAWLGIPFAEKPLGDLRFKRPVPIRNWRGVYHATKLQNTCFQNPDKIYPGFWGTELWNPNTPVSEDCLYLNVWTVNPRPKKPVPVMVSIYLHIKNSTYSKFYCKPLIALDLWWKLSVWHINTGDL